MNDNDIIKALEHCVSGTTAEVCNGCPFIATTICTETENGVLIHALDLISRQKAEIERLYKTINMTEKEQYINGRNDSIKEFAKKLKEKKYLVVEPEFSEYAVTVQDIDDLVNELTEAHHD